jgi:competence protein ComEA
LQSRRAAARRPESRLGETAIRAPGRLVGKVEGAVREAVSPDQARRAARSNTEQALSRRNVMTLRRIVATGLALVMAAVLSGGSALAAGKAAPGAKVNINTASVEQLTTLPGVGPKLAARIVEYRQKSGPFHSTQDLINVRGIGEKNFAKIERWLSVGEAGKAPSK